jgi:hypothetical protein
MIPPMGKTYLFIDFENIQNIDLPTLRDTEVEIKIFVGESQQKIPFDLVQAAQTFGGAIEWVKIEGTGKNALDFHIAFYLGRLSAADRSAAFIILSKDTGFDPLVRHVKKHHIACRRIDSILELSKRNELLAPNNEIVAKVLENLSKIHKNRRPRTRRTLHQHIHGLFLRKESESTINTLIDSLFVQKKLAEENNKLIYHF